MKMFGRSGGYWLFWTSAVYFVVGMVDVFYLENDYTIPIQLFWLTCLALPLVVKPLARWLNMRTFWEL